MFKTLIALSFITVGLTSAANAQVTGCVVAPGNRCEPAPVEQSIQRTIYMNQYVRDQRLDLQYLFGYQMRDFDGAILDAVEVVAQEGNMGLGSLELLADGRVEDYQNWVNGLTVLQPIGQVQLGYYGSRLELVARSTMYIQTITIKAHRAFGPPNPPSNGLELRQPIRRSFLGYQRIPVGQLINLGQYRGYRLLEVSVRASSYSNRWGQATLLVNGFNSGTVNVDGFMREYIYRIQGPGVIGRGVDSLVLDVSNVQIDDVILRLAR